MNTLKAKTLLVAAAAFLLAGVSLASAAPMPAPSAGNKMAPPASETLSLTTSQRKTAWHDLYAKSLNQAAPKNFEPAVGAVLPKSVTVAPIPKKAATDVPALKPYKFAMLRHKLLIVNASDHKIAEVITE